MISSAVPLTGVPFPRSEYERRQLNVLEAVASAGLDALHIPNKLCSETATYSGLALTS